MHEWGVGWTSVLNRAKSEACPVTRASHLLRWTCAALSRFDSIVGWAGVHQDVVGDGPGHAVFERKVSSIFGCFVAALDSHSRLLFLVCLLGMLVGFVVELLSNPSDKAFVGTIRWSTHNDDFSHIIKTSGFA
jgi:hypothetical protein